MIATEQFYSERGEDKWIAENLPLPETGIYVDIGCGFPKECSNTAFLRARGWHGINIDGNPRYQREWDLENQPDPFICAIISPNPIVLFDICHREPWLSRICAHGTEHYTMRLETVLEAHDIYKIDFVSLDVEGHEFDVLKSLDFDKHDPTIMVVEFNTREIGEDHRIQPFLENKGYQLRHTTIPNLIFSK